MNKTLTVDFFSDRGSALAELSVYGDPEIESLLESGRYEYELDSGAYSLKEIPGVISRSRIAHDCERGWIEPGNYVGLLRLELLDKETDERVAQTHVDVHSRKLGYEDENLDEEKIAQRAGNYKRADLLKMHAYRDAIRRSAGAYVLYPGGEKEQPPFHGFHELLPGLGAFPLRPNEADDGSSAIERFYEGRNAERLVFGLLCG